MKKNIQELAWEGAHGDAYTKRNWKLLNRQTNQKKFYEMFKNLPLDYSVLEVGCNTASNLEVLQNMGFTNLTGIDINKGAIVECKKRFPKMKFELGTAIKLPFLSNSFDIVFTAGVLIHQCPNDGDKDKDSSLIIALKEIIRTSKKIIIGLEDFDTSPKNQGGSQYNNKYWSGPFADLYLKTDESLKLDQNYKVQGTEIGNSDNRLRHIFKIIK